MISVSSWTANITAALIQIRGEAARDSRGNRLPMITPLDTIAVLARYSPMLVGSITNLQAHEGVEVGAINIRSVTADGRLLAAGIGGGIVTGSSTVIERMVNGDVKGRITIQKYLAGYGNPSLPYQRRPDKTSDLHTFYGRPNEMLSETALISAHREAVRDWQRGIDASVAALLASPLDLTKPLRPDDNAAFWSAIRGLSASLDAIGANPPEEVFDRIKGATSAALNEAGRVAGEGAAKLADQVGQIAGHAAEGFLTTASALSLIVAGLAVYLVVK